MTFMTISKQFVDNLRIPSRFTYRLSLVQPQLTPSSVQQQWPPSVNNSPLLPATDGYHSKVLPLNSLEMA